MNREVCPGCKQPIDSCYYGGDCLEVRAIYRDQQREKLADIDVSELTNECCDCGCLIDDGYFYCYSCEKGGNR